MYEKYNNLAREALASGDKIMSENYFQHADYFKRILNEQESIKKARTDETNDVREKKIDLNNGIEKSDKSLIKEDSA